MKKIIIILVVILGIGLILLSYNKTYRYGYKPMVKNQTLKTSMLFILEDSMANITIKDYNGTSIKKGKMGARVENDFIIDYIDDKNLKLNIVKQKNQIRSLFDRNNENNTAYKELEGLKVDFFRQNAYSYTLSKFGNNFSDSRIETLENLINTNPNICREDQDRYNIKPKLKVGEKWTESDKYFKYFGELATNYSGDIEYEVIGIEDGREKSDKIITIAYKTALIDNNLSYTLDYLSMKIDLEGEIRYSTKYSTDISVSGEGKYYVKMGINEFMKSVNIESTGPCKFLYVSEIY